MYFLHVQAPTVKMSFQSASACDDGRTGTVTTGRSKVNRFTVYILLNASETIQFGTSNTYRPWLDRIDAADGEDRERETKE